VSWSPLTPLPKNVRLLLPVALVAGGYALGRRLGLTESVDVEALRSWMEGAGVTGFLVFVAIMVAGQLVQIPAMVFFIAAIFAYGGPVGAVASLVGAIVSVSITFFVVRTIGGQPLAGLSQSWVRRILDHLDEHPIRSVAVLRMALWALPPLNYALAMSSIGYRDYIVGSILGLIPPILVVATFFDLIARAF